MSESSPRGTIRNSGEADEPRMVELLFRAFGRWPQFEIQVSPLEHLRWKMRSDPIAARHHLVTEIADAIAAMMLVVVRRVRLKGRDCLARDGVDAAVELVSCWMISRPPYNAILRRYGFFDSRRDVGLRYRAVGLDERELEFLSDPGARIHLTRGDSDWI